MSHLCTSCKGVALFNVQHCSPTAPWQAPMCMACVDLITKKSPNANLSFRPLEEIKAPGAQLIATIDRLCTVIETSIAEGSTIEACPVAVDARRLIATTTQPTSGTIPAKAEV